MTDVFVRMLAIIAGIAAAGLLVAVVKAIRYERFWAGWQAGRRFLHRDQTGTEPAGYVPVALRNQRRQP